MNFREWAINNGYSKNLSIDRINNNGNYEPKNCRWSDNYTQANNKRNNRLLIAFGKTLTVSQWSKEPECNVSLKLLQLRIDRGMEPERAISIPRLTSSDAAKKGAKITLEAFGEKKTISQWAEDSRCVVIRKTLDKRIGRGWTPEQAIITPSTKNKN